MIMTINQTWCMLKGLLRGHRTKLDILCICMCVHVHMCMHLIHSLIIILLYKSEVLEGDFTPKPYLLVVTHSVSVYLYTV